MIGLVIKILNMNKFEHIKSKIISRDELSRLLSILKFKKQKIVFTNGCFDIVHRGHAEYLAKARSLGNYMIVGLNSDNSVTRLKGENRPLQEQSSRAIILASFGFVDNVVIFDEDTPYDLIKLIQPDILVKGADYKPEDVVGYDIVTESGGKILTIELVEGFSTTNIVNKISST